MNKLHVKKGDTVVAISGKNKGKKGTVLEVRLYCDKCDKPVRVGYKVLESGEKVRYCKKCGETI